MKRFNRICALIVMLLSLASTTSATETQGKNDLNVTLLSASLRHESYNRKLIDIVAKLVKEKYSSCTVTIVDLNDYKMPYYNEDIENNQGLPKSTLALNKLLLQSDILIIASPEYNSSLPGHFKNTIDWISRCKPQAFANKPILLLSASPSTIGGNRGLGALRSPLEVLGAFVFPNTFSLAQAHDGFTTNSKLKSAENNLRLEKTVKSFMKFASALRSSDD